MVGHDNLHKSVALRYILFMQSLRFQLPPPNTLVSFEAAARHLSFTAAAAELNVTRVAVSRQIKALEDILGVSLFRRLHRKLALTTDGAVYFEVVGTALRQVAATTAEIQERKPFNRVTVTTTVGFSSYWLVPQIGVFRKSFPDIDIRVLVSDSVIDLSQEGIDVAIRYGRGSWPNTQSQFLLQESISPTCSARYFSNRKKLQHPADLLNETLLHLEGPYDEQVKWRWWFKAHGVDLPEKRLGLAFNSYVHLVQALLDGQGIALVGPPLLTPYYESGTLIRPIDLPPITRKAFHLVVPDGQSRTPSIDAFCKWVVEQTMEIKS
jgi:LysR family glycine cleavage system transcriptional activator